MSITDLYEAVTFNEVVEGPGCGVVEHDDDCLCDVPRHRDCSDCNQPIVIGPMQKLAIRLAEERTGRSITGMDLEAWAGELLGLMAELDARGKDTGLTERMEEIRQRLMLKIQQPGRIRDGSKAAGRYAWQAEVIELLRCGLTLTEIAAYVGVFVEDVTRCLNQGGVSVSAYLMAEKLLRSGEAESLGTVAEATGLSRYVVRRLADALGVETKTAERRHAGGGDKYTAQQYADVLRLRSEGLSFGKIEKITGVERSAAFRIYQRRAA